MVGRPRSSTIGTCDLVVARTFDAGWLARIDDGPLSMWCPLMAACWAVRIEGSGTHRVTLQYYPHRFMYHATISLVASCPGRVLRRGRSSCGWRRSPMRGEGRAGRHGLSFSSSPPIVSISEAISRSPKSNRTPAAAKSSGSGREPPSASAFL